jgi:hypothetical protein
MLGEKMGKNEQAKDYKILLKKSVDAPLSLRTATMERHNDNEENVNFNIPLGTSIAEEYDILNHPLDEEFPI